MTAPGGTLPYEVKGMSKKRIGVAISGSDSSAVLAGIDRAEDMGIHAAWLTTGGARLDSLTLFASAALRTSRIMLGTAIVPTFPRHPLVTVQQTQVIAQLAPGRFRLGVGPSHRPSIEDTHGIKFRAPLGHLSEYVYILKALLHEGSVDFQGRYYSAHAQIVAPVDVPVMASALQPRSFELCGAEADGAISWICPRAYLREVALPAMQAGAAKAGCTVPPLIAHAPVCLHEKPDEVRAAVREQVFNTRMPFYQRMFESAGFPEASSGNWSDDMVDATVLWGDESQVAEGIQELFSMGATEVLASPILAGGDQTASLNRTMELLARVSRSLNS